MWQPIETAPKDGTPFLACGEFYYPMTIPEVHMAWFNKKSGDLEKWPLLVPPAHWMPIPEPPTGTRELGIWR